MFKVHRTFTLSTGVKNASIAVVADGSRVDVIYHKTLVVSKRGKTVTLRNGGWDTISTRAVINQALRELGTPYRLDRKKGVTVLIEDRDIGFSRVRDVVGPFVSGMKFKVAS